MASATNGKKQVLANSEVKYRVQVWHEGKFHCSKTFDIEKLARDYKEERLNDIVRVQFKPAAERAAQRRAEEVLDQPMTHWASLYVEEVVHGNSRLGRLLASKTPGDFNGKAGGRLIKQLPIDWRHDRRPRSKKAPEIGAPAPKPLGGQTLRLRLFALLRTIRFANDKLATAPSCDVAAKLAPIWRGRQADAALARADGPAQQAQAIPATDIGAGTESFGVQRVGSRAPASHASIHQGQVAHMPAKRGAASEAEFQPQTERPHDSPLFARGNRCPDDIDQAHAFRPIAVLSHHGQANCPALRCIAKMSGGLENAVSCTGCRGSAGRPIS